MNKNKIKHKLNKINNQKKIFNYNKQDLINKSLLLKYKKKCQT